MKQLSINIYTTLALLLCCFTFYLQSCINSTQTGITSRTVTTMFHRQPDTCPGGGAARELIQQLGLWDLSIRVVYLLLAVTLAVFSIFPKLKN